MDAEKYKPTEHDGLKTDGTPDMRVSGSEDISTSENSNNANNGGFAHGKVDPIEAGRAGGLAAHRSAGSDNSTGDSGGFAHGKVDPVEAGRAGGLASHTSDDNNTETSGGFAHGKVDPVEAGRAGGKAAH